jgi:hypothetical protein
VLDVACMLDMYLFSVGFSTTFAALFSKNLAHFCTCEREEVSVMRDDPSERRLAAVCHLDSTEPGYSNRLTISCSPTVARDRGERHVWSSRE